MPEPVQTTIYGTTEPIRARSAPVGVPAPVRLFDAPQTMRGQLAIATDERSEDLTAPNEPPTRGNPMTTTYRVVNNTLLDHATNPAIAHDRDDVVTRDELDALIRSVNKLHGFALTTDLTTYDDDGSLWWDDEKVAELASAP